MAYTVQNILYDYELKTRYSPVYQKTIQQLTCIIPGGGCVYYRAHKGDVCPFCAFPPFSRYVIKGDGYDNYYGVWTLDSVIYKEMYLDTVNNNQSYNKLAIFNGGSFFPKTEIPLDIQRFVYEDVEARPNIEQLMVEAYPSVITEKRLSEAKEVLQSTDFMVGIGFESQDDRVRNYLLKKRIDKELFEKKIHLMQRLGVQVFIYAFLKAPGLNEGEAVEETLATIKYLYNLGVDEIALSCAFVPPGTDLEKKYHASEFRPPWLWSILKIMEEAKKNDWPLSIGGFEDSPPPIAGPSNCDQCDDSINRIIDIHRLNGSYLQQPKEKCTCHSKWLLDMKGVSELKIMN